MQDEGIRYISNPNLVYFDCKGSCRCSACDQVLKLHDISSDIEGGF